MSTDDEHLSRRATAELTSRLLGRAIADSTFALATNLAASARRERTEAELRDAIATIAPLLPAALAAALARGRADEELGLAATAKLFEKSPRWLRGLVRAGRCPIPFRLVGTTVRFCRRDVDAHLCPAPDVQGPTRVLSEALEAALPTSADRALIPTEVAAALLELKPARLRHLLRTGRAPVPPARVGAKIFFSRDAVMAAAAKAKAPTTSDVPAIDNEQPARASRGRR